MTRQEEIKIKANYFARVSCPMTCSRNGAEDCFIQGAIWADKTMIENAGEWLKGNVNDYLEWYDWERCMVNIDELLHDFRKAMEEQQ